MAEKKTVKASSAKPKAKPVKAKRSAVVASKPAAKKAAGKDSAPAKETAQAEPKLPSKRSYKPRKQKVALAGFADTLQKKQSELDDIKKRAKAELQKLYEGKMREAEGIKLQYKSLFDEPIESVPKARKPAGPGRKASGAKAGAAAPISLGEVESFLEQKEGGKDAASIKLPGRKPKSVLKIAEAYDRADEKTARTIHDLLS